LGKSFLIIIWFAVIGPGIIDAQDTLPKKELRKQKADYLLHDRPWTLEIPLWIPGFAGYFSYGNIDIEGEDGIDPSNPIEPPPGGSIGKIFSRLFSTDWKLNFFYLTKIAYEREQFMVQFDAITGAVGETTKFNFNDNQIIKANFRTTNCRLIGGYKIIDTQSEGENFQYELFGYTGIRTHFHKVHSNLNSIINNLDINPIWVEPVLGVMNQFTWKRWFAVVQGDYGGYFLESKYSVQLTAYVYYRTGKATSLKLGWNHLYLDQSGSFLRQDFGINATFSGPCAGIALHF
jgi:hypothetical protein